MKKDTHVTKVIFYKAVYQPLESDEQPTTEIVAVFPDELYNEKLYGKGILTCYTHVGQHGSASKEFITESCQLANQSEYEPLKRELESIGYNLKTN